MGSPDRAGKAIPARATTTAERIHFSNRQSRMKFNDARRKEVYTGAKGKARIICIL